MEYFKKEKKNKKKNEKINKEKDLKDNTSNDKVKYFLMIPLEQENFIETFNSFYILFKININKYRLIK